MKQVFVSAALLLSGFIVSVSANGQNRTDGALINTISGATPGPITNEVFRFKPGITTHFLNGALPSGGTTGFGATDRWLSFGQVTGTAQDIYGFRTQVNGRGLSSGFSIPSGGSVSNPFIEWIGNTGTTAGTGNLEFNYALSATGAAAARVSAFAIQPVSPIAPTNFNAYAYARANCLLGQLQSGVYGGFSSGDKWVGIGNVITSTSSFIGTRVQANSANLITGVESTTPFIQFNAAGNNTLPRGLQFRGDIGAGSPTDIMKMDTEGRIDIGVDPAASPIDLTLYNYNLFVSGRLNTGVSSTAAIGVGVYARPSLVNTQQAYRQIGVFGEATFGNQNGGAIGIYGTVNNPASSDYAGFFNGNVLASSFITASDKRLKKDIKEEVSALEKIMLLKPVSYTYDKTASKWMNLEYNKTSHGFIADEVLAIFPEMVNEFAEPVMGTAKELEAAKKFKAVNYIQLISVLTKGMQEQQAEIIALKNELVASRTVVLNNKTALPLEIENKAFSLSQNVPNPFSEKTTISYSIPTNVTKAVLAVFDLNGRMLLQYNLQQGKNQLTINGNSFPAGMYIYSLIADGQEVVSKRMVLTK